MKTNLESRENVGWASTCNSVGQTVGFFLGNVVFLALESTNFANLYVRKPGKMINYPKKSTYFVFFS
jgi:hypothetical protein